MRLIIRYSLVVGLVLSIYSFQACAQANKTTSDSARINTLEMSMSMGKLVYDQNCLVCHQADGGGVPHLNPPLRQTDYVLGEKARIIGIVLNGLDAHEPINDEVYSNVMPAHDFLTDQQIADVLTFVRNSFDNKASAVLVSEVKAERAKKK